MRFLARHPVLAAVLVVALGALALVAVTGYAVWRAAHTDEASRVSRADAIVVLGAAQYNGRPSPVFRARLDHAASMYRNGFSPRVVVTGGGRPGDNFSEGEAGRMYLVQEGLPEGAVEAVASGRTTKQSLADVAGWMDGRGLDTAFLVSDPWHNLRVRRMARDLGIDAYVSATGASAARTQETRSTGYLRETFAYLWYRVTGR